MKRDIRGFITNRLMYALLREAFHLVAKGYAAPADIDRSMRNDLGYWITFAGPFRFMDLTGIPAYAAVMKDLFPELDCSREVPELMKQVVESGGLGVANAKGFYEYTPEQAKRWEELFLEYTYDIRALAMKYPDVWAALAPIAPAVFRPVSDLEKVKHIPVILVQGDQDRLVPVESARRWAEQMKKHEMTYEYIEVAGGNHVDVAMKNMERIFDFFAKHQRKSTAP